MIPLPAEIDVPVLYGLTLLTANIPAQRLALFILSETGQTIIEKNGLIAVAHAP